MANSSGPRRPFQFHLWQLMLLPVGVAAFFALAAWLGTAEAIALAGILVGVPGLFFRKTRTAALVMLGMMLLLALLWPKYAVSPQATRRGKCGNNLKRIAMALHTYHHMYGSFPPAFIADEQGRPMHSWRVLILPFLLNRSLYGQYRFDEPWNGPNNSRLAAAMPEAYSCPSEKRLRGAVGSMPMTSYVVVTGPRTAWPGERAPKISDIIDGPSNTILVVETVNSGIHWMEPRDFHVSQMARGINPKTGQGISSAHYGGVDAAFADGSVFFLSEELSPHNFDALLTIDGGEKLDDTWKY